MKITKYIHSCLLIEVPGRTVLIDPGSMSTPSIDLNTLPVINELLITHIHGDHYNREFIKALVAKHSDLQIISTQEVVDDLASIGIMASTTPPDGMQLFEAPHESVEPIFPQPQAVGFHLFDALSHPGDSHSFTGTKPILAMPVTGPWGSFIHALKTIAALKPAHVLPIHDWHWSDAARQSSYGIATDYLAKQGITFHPLVSGDPIEIELEGGTA